MCEFTVSGPVAYICAVDTHERYMHRCIDLAKIGGGYVAPNPLVGAVLAHEGRIIGEGYHKKFGQPHAEVNCLSSVEPDDLKLIPYSTLYVSLEPCVHHGKTPPCTDLIISKKIPHVVVGCKDPYKEVSGRGIEKMQAAGIQVTWPVLEKQCREINHRFITFQEQQRPYIILKWAESADGLIAPQNRSRTNISGEFTRRLVHKWRSEEASILVGTNTVQYDDPILNNRYWPGPSPVRLVLDMNLRLPALSKVFDGTIRTIVFNAKKNDLQKDKLLTFYKLSGSQSIVEQIIDALYQLRIQSVIVEGGAQLLESFIREGKWDEIRKITSSNISLGEGIPSPAFLGRLIEEETLHNDRIGIFKPLNNP